MDTASDQRSALILYGSETGNSYDLAQELGRICERLRFATTICDLNSAPLSKLLQFSLTLFAISTTGQGDLPVNAQLFWKALRRAKLPPGCLQTLRFSSFGLGDSSYPKFNWAHRKLYNRLIQLGALPICDKGEADEQHPEGIDGTFIPWSINLKSRILENFPLPSGVLPIADDIYLEPQWILQVKSDTLTTFAESDYAEPLSDLIHVADGIVGTVRQNQRVTSESHGQDTRHITLELSGNHEYHPGDTLTIYPKNFPSDVSDLIDRMDWKEIADKPIQFIANPAASNVSQACPVNIPENHTLTLRNLLTNHLDIMSIPRRSFFMQLIHYTNDEMYVERLKEFVSPELVDELYDYTTRPRRSILEVLSDFHTIKLPWNIICSIIPLMRGRQFSIASGGQLKHSNGNTNIELLIAIVKYRTILKRIRHGVATRYIATFEPGQQITVTLQKGSLNITPEDLERPVVMIAPGTGVAPMRSLVWERKAQRDEFKLDRNKDVLFFGCRKKDADEYFVDEWPLLHLQVFTAYSRDQKQKVYVQDVIKEQGQIVFKALAEQGGLVFVCGSSGRMPQAVRNALTEVFQIQGDMAMSDAEAYLSKMEKDGRYKQETW